MNKHRFILKPYKSRADRKECPCCHVKGCFSQYIDTVGRIAFPPDVGRCNREHKCGYHYTDHPDMKEELMDDAAILSPTLPTPPQPKAERFFFPRSVMESSMSHYRENNFFLFLCSRFGEQAALELAGRYNIGTAKVRKGSCVFWQVDIRGRVCQGKVMFYDASTGNRSDLPVGIVESEKSAIIASYYLPDYIWLACGGKDGMFGKADLDIFKDRKVVLFPDLGMLENWEGKAERLRRHGIDTHVFTYLEEHASQSEKERGLDIADYLNRDSQYTDDLTTSGSKVGSILQEVFLSYKNVLAVRSRWSQMWVWEACFTFCDNMIIVYLYIMIFVYLHNMIFVYFDIINFIFYTFTIFVFYSFHVL